MNELLLVCCNGPDGPTYLIGQEVSVAPALQEVDETGGLNFATSIATPDHMIRLRAPLIAMLISVEKINSRIRFLQSEKEVAQAQSNGAVCSLPQLLPDATLLCSLSDPTDYVNAVYELSAERLVSRLPVAADSILGIAYEVTMEMLDNTDSSLVRTIRESHSLDIRHIITSLADPDKRRQVQYTKEVVD